MSKTYDLRKVIAAQLSISTGAVYHKRAPASAAMPYKVYALRSINLGDLSRDDVMLEVDVWDLSPDTKTVDSIADDVEAQLNNANLPQDTILPTFFRDGRYMIEDDNKDIQHLRLTFQVQNYER